MKRDTPRCCNFAFRAGGYSDDQLGGSSVQPVANARLPPSSSLSYFLSGPSNSIVHPTILLSLIRAEEDPHSSAFLFPNTPSPRPYPREERARLTFTRLTKEVRDPLTPATNLRFRKSGKSLRPTSLAFHLSGKHRR